MDEGIQNLGNAKESAETAQWSVENSATLGELLVKSHYLKFILPLLHWAVIIQSIV